MYRARRPCRRRGSVQPRPAHNQLPTEVDDSEFDSLRVRRADIALKQKRHLPAILVAWFLNVGLCVFLRPFWG